MGHSAVFKIKTETVKPEIRLRTNWTDEYYAISEKVIEEKYETIKSVYSEHDPFRSGDIITLNDKEFKILTVKKELSGKYIYEVDDIRTIKVENYDEWEKSLERLLEKNNKAYSEYKSLYRKHEDLLCDYQTLKERNWIQRLFNK